MNRRATRTITLSFPLVAVIFSAAACQDTPTGTTNPGFAITGIVEGFYGTPWSHQDRLDVMAFMGDVGLNAFFYAPKADPYHLARWREPYPPQEWQQLAELARSADANNVTLWYAISPGLTMQYSDPVDYATLLAKIDTIATLGIRHFGLFLDDVPLELTDPTDVSQFEDLAAAHVSLTNRLHADLAARSYQLAVTPTVYTPTWGAPPYIDRLGAEVHPDVHIIWTGPDVVAREITHEQSKAWSDRLRRRLILWDNYPVNDFAPWRMFLGPLRGRDPELASTTVGILANPMNQAHASMVPLRTLADYAADPAHYDPDTSWQRAIGDVFGSETGDRLRPILDAFGDYASSENLLEPLYFLRDTIEVGAIERSIASLTATLEEAQASHAAPSATTAKIFDQMRLILERANERLERLRIDARYRLVGERLVFDHTEVFEVTAAEGPALPDGDLSDWASREWHALRGEPRSLISLAADETTLRIALRVEAEDVSVREAAAIGEGTHVAMVVMHDDSSMLISPEDLVILVAPGGGRVADPSYIGSMRFEGFMSKWLADNENLTFTEFHVTTFGDAAHPAMEQVARGVRFGSRRSDTGFTMEIHLPHQQRDQRVSITVSSRVEGRRRSASLAQRNYPLNPATLVRARLPAVPR